MLQPLCPQLYEALRKRFGVVKIHASGEKIDRSLILKGTQARTLIKGGEYYAVCCPFCRDQHYRLWISYSFAEYPWLCHCYNEQCLRYPERKQWLRLQLRLPRHVLHLSTHDEEALPAGPSPEAAWPGECLPLQQLPQHHPARSYLRGRSFDPDEIAQLYDVRYCTRCGPEEIRALNRLIIPVYWQGKLVGWQGRLLDNSRRFPEKYYTMPGMRRRELLYDFDRARESSCVIVCEGPTDVWRVGPGGTALFGKTATPTQISLLLMLTPPTTPLLVLLDGNAEPEARALEEQLRAGRPGLVGRIQLRPEQDPGSLATDLLLDRIAGVLAELPAGKEDLWNSPPCVPSSVSSVSTRE